jgi:uncharacterized protein (DUF362 family)
MEGRGPWNGDPIQSNVLVAGYDLMATDVVAAQLMGYALDRIPLYHYGVQAGLGVLDLEGIELVGGEIEDFKVGFERNSRFEAWAAQWLAERE